MAIKGSVLLLTNGQQALLFCRKVREQQDQAVFLQEKSEYFYSQSYDNCLLEVH